MLLRGDIFSLEEIVKDIAILLETKNIVAMISFLFALVSVYGHLDEEEAYIHSARIHLPLVGSIVRFEKPIQDMMDILAEQGIYTTSSVEQQKYGQILQIHISDGELLQIFASWLDKKSSKRQSLQEQKSSLLAFLEEDGADTHVL